MARLSSNPSTGRVNELWPVLLILLVVAVPTIGVLWFVGVAVDNQQLAAKQRLKEAYQSNLVSVRAQLDTDWEELLQETERAYVNSTRPRESFLSVTAIPGIDSALCFDSGELIYPGSQEALSDTVVDDPRWGKAKEMENIGASPHLAQHLYAEIANDAKDQRSYALAMQGQVRCLLKSKQKSKAIELVISALENQSVGRITDAVASHAIANIELMAIENAPSGEERQRIWERLSERIFADPDGTLPGPQRLFIMRRMLEISPTPASQRQLVAEDLAAAIANSDVPVSGKEYTGLCQSPIEGVWQNSSADGNLLLLFKTQTLQELADDAATSLAIPPGIQISLLPPETVPPFNANAVRMRAGENMPGWQLWLSHRDDDGSLAGLESNRIHIWTAALVVLFSSILAVVIARAFQQKLRVANLKNDLVGTVSHELKTPLASMRLLVETLLSKPELEEQQTREYLQLIDKENVRLSRLIENFLTFSRMEQDRHTFQFTDVDLAEVIQEAIDTMGDRLREPTCNLTASIPASLPNVWGDKDALVTVFLNLLDNAYKYSGPAAQGEGATSSTKNADRQITILANTEQDEIWITVVDNGIGLSRTATRRVFDRFFQVDQRLIRKGQGCGLGLSIVDYIVRAHEGAIDVISELNRGSRFRVKLPIADNGNQGESDRNG